MSRVTIIVEDGFVSVDGVGYSGLDLSSVPSDVHAVQFNGDSGWVEYELRSDGTLPDNKPITNLSDFQGALDAWQAAYDAAHAPPPPPTDEERYAALERESQVALDNFAELRGYYDIVSLCSYAVSTNPVFSAEGRFGMDKRDSVWSTVYACIDDAKKGLRPIPNNASEIPLPVLDWSDFSAS